MHYLLKSCIPVADMIAGTFGPRCEVAVHDLTQPESSVVYVANGTVTGRRIGQSFDHLVRQVLMNPDFHDDRVINYTFETADGRPIKSSSALIRDENGQVIGMLCINYDISLEQQLQGALAGFLGAAPQPVPKQTGDVTGEVETILQGLIERIIGDADVRNMPRRKSVELIRFMDEKGIFLVKGAVEKVAALMGVSKVTVYSYLNEAREKEAEA